MKKAYSFLIVLAMPVTLLLFSYVSGSPGGKTGSPGDNGNTCTECHGGTAQSQFMWISSTIPAEGFTPGETYQITATGTHPGVVKFGFELTAENNMGAKTGIFTITDATRTKLANGGHSVTHKSAGVTPAGNTNSWTMDWTAPEAGPVTFYAAFNAANGNGNTGGDIIYTSSLMVNELVLNPVITGVDPAHAPLAFTGDLAVMGMDTQWESGVSEVRFAFHDDPMEMFSASTIVVESNTLLTVSVTIPDNIPVGSYDVYVDDLMLANGFVVDQLDAIQNTELAEGVTIFPNPTADFLQVKAPLGSKLTLVDMQGRVLRTVNVEQETTRLNVMDFPAGYYFMNIRLDGNQATKKWLKK